MRKLWALIFGITAILIAGGLWLWIQFYPGLKPIISSPQIPQSKSHLPIAPDNDQPTIPDTSETVAFLKVPDGYRISYFAKNIEDARDIEEDNKGNLLISSPDTGTVYVLSDKDKDGTAEVQKKLITGLKKPHGLAFVCGGYVDNPCYIFVAETNKVVRYLYNSETFTVSEAKKIADLPNEGFHSTRSLLALPVQNPEIEPIKIYISIGSTCNVCVEKDERRASIYSVNFDGTDFHKVASGLRNSVFLEQHPNTGEIWATDMGRDSLGDDLPPDEVNIIKENQDYGWPYCYGANIKDPYNKGSVDCSQKTGSKIDLQAHSAPLGLAFWDPQRSTSLETDTGVWSKSLLVAYHGSWNRSEPTGYKIVRFSLDAKDEVGGQEDFITGFINDKDEAYGRPVDVHVATDGSVYVSDDKLGAVYHLTKSRE